MTGSPGEMAYSEGQFKSENVSGFEAGDQTGPFDEKQKQKPEVRNPTIQSLKVPGTNMTYLIFFRPC
jgi:hypothetical protein